MNKFLSAVAVSALLFATGVASADETSGKIQQVNEEARSMTLDNGQSFGLAEGVEIEGLQPGTEVKVSFEQNDSGQNIATAVEQVGAQQ